MGIFPPYLPTGQKVANMVRDEKGQINFCEKIFLKSTAVLEIPPEG
jgi:hypothetical protein